MKTRHPISVISPVLAHNISLAAGRFTNQPFSALVSSLGSKLAFDSRSRAAVQQRLGQYPKLINQPCPLTKMQYNYNQCQVINEDANEEIEEEEEGYCKSNGFTIPKQADENDSVGTCKVSYLNTNASV